MTFKTTFGINAQDQYPQHVQDFIDGSLEGLRLQTAAHHNLWKIGEADRWNVNLNAGEIIWSFQDGTRVTSRIQVVGTYTPQDSTFMWAWENPSIPEALTDHALKVKAYGETEGVQDFVDPEVFCSEEEGWAFAAVACRLAEANGVYRGNAGGTLVFMTFTEVQISRT